MSRADSLVVLDFETTGLSPDGGDRAIEIGAVRIEDGCITDTFQALMNPGFKISGFIEDYTGITNEMLADARPCANVMSDFGDFIAKSNLVAHNASFDQRFLQTELTYIGRPLLGTFACSLLAARRIFPNAPDYKLSTLVRYMGIGSEGQFHRALYDAEMAAGVWLGTLSAMVDQYQLNTVGFEVMIKLNKTAKKSVPQFLSRVANGQ